MHKIYSFLNDLQCIVTSVIPEVLSMVVIIIIIIIIVFHVHLLASP